MVSVWVNQIVLADFQCDAGGLQTGNLNLNRSGGYLGVTGGVCGGLVDDEHGFPSFMSNCQNHRILAILGGGGVSLSLPTADFYDLSPIGINS